MADLRRLEAKDLTDAQLDDLFAEIALWGETVFEVSGVLRERLEAYLAGPEVWARVVAVMEAIADQTGGTNRGGVIWDKLARALVQGLPQPVYVTERP